MGRRKKRITQLQSLAKTMVKTRMAEKQAKQTSARESSAILPADLASATSSAASPTPTAAKPTEPTMAVKRKSLLSSEKQEEKSEKKDDNILISERELSEIAAGVLCPECVTQNVNINFVHHQVDTYMKMICNNCKHIIYDNTKQMKEVKKVNDQKFFPKTIMLVYCMMMLGCGYVGIEKVIVFLGLRKFSFATFMKYAKFITQCAVDHSRAILDKSRRVVYDNHDKDDNGNVDIAISFDGSWHKRGYRSNFGVNAVIETDTGLIIDYEVLSLLCEKCIHKTSMMEKKKISETQYIHWLDSHLDSDCDQNYEGSSGGMEAEAAVRMWGRSLNYNLRYMSVVSDGDSSTYAAIKGMNGGTGPYGTYGTVVKLECVNHVAKRFGYGTREAKKKYVEPESENDEPSTSAKKKGPAKKKSKVSMGGQDKLTNVVIDYLQYYFTVSMNRKIGTTTEEMRNEILSTFYHCSSSDDNPQHDLCTKGANSWCFYNRAIARNSPPESHTGMKIYFRLSKNELSVLKNVYDRLTTDEMMLKCIKGLTQNRNESLHHRIWQLCPKSMRASKRKVDFAMATAVVRYNAGYIEASLCSYFGIQHSASMLNYLEKLDKRMNTPARRKMRRKIVRRDLEYAAGAF